MPTDEDAPPVALSEPMEMEATPVGFWSELVSAIRKELRPPVSGFFVSTPNAPIQGELRGNQVVLKCANDFTLEMINKPDILALVSRKASAILNRPVTTKAVDRTAKPENNARMEQLLSFGREHSDIVKIKDN
jgi:hypothetical protein